jgi:hypothetical protein
MAKYLVETTGSFQVVDPRTGAVVPHNRPMVVQLTHLIHTRINSGQLRVLAKDLPDGANDADFVGFWKESKGDKELAVESYVSSLVPTLEFDPKPKGKGK